MSTEFSVEKEREYYSKPVPTYVPYDEAFTRKLLQSCTGDPGLFLEDKIVLEIGAGECLYVESIMKGFRPAKYICTELFEDRMARAKAALSVYPNVVLQAVDAYKLPFRDGSIDTVLAFGVLHHFPDLGRALKELARVLKGGGVLVGRDPWAGNPLIWFHEKFLHMPSENERPLTVKRLENKLKESGFSVRHLKGVWLRFPHLPPGPWSTNIGYTAVRV